MEWILIAAAVVAWVFQSLMAGSAMGVFAEGYEGWIPPTRW